ncbi:MAG: diaminopimelate epimerase [Planctomycetota bacterium]
MTKVRGTRAEGCGNAYVFVDEEDVGSDAAARLRDCAPHATPRWLSALGGARLDGVILLELDATCERRLTVWNADGSRGEVCGNGLRAAALLARTRRGSAEGALRSDSAVHRYEVVVSGSEPRVRVTLPPPRVELDAVPCDARRAGACSTGPRGLQRLELVAAGREFSGYVLSVGNPHLVLPTDDLREGEPLGFEGLECHPAFPARVNVTLMRRVSADAIATRTHERGSGETAACGTAACASAFVSYALGLTDPSVEVRQRGGVLGVEVRPDELVLAGPASVGDAVEFEI